MDETTLKVAIAAFTHDLGKFADKDVLSVTDQYIDAHAGLYLPFYNGRYSHYHAVYTAAFIEQMNGVLPSELNSPGWGEEDSFINLAAGHHNPATPLQWVVALADRVSSGWDRDTFDKEYNRQIAIKDYKKTRLLPLFEQLMKDEENEPDRMEDFSYCYPLKEISPETIFPGLRKEIAPETTEEAADDYSRLFDEFAKGLKRLRYRNVNLELWFENFESLMMVYTSSIPAARVGDIVPDVSLYDHSKATAAIAAAIYLYHRESASYTVDAIRNYEDKKFLIVNGNFKGIQNFIFGGYGDARKYRSKILRGRSFTVSLLAELSADMLCREVGLPFTSIILNAAGKFTILAPNTDKVREGIDKVERKINDWLVKVSFGETVICLSSVGASCNDFVSGNFQTLWDKSIVAMAEKSFSRLDLSRYGGVVERYLDSFDNDLTHPLCPICGKRPSCREAEGTAYVEETQSACSLCRDHVFLGTNLVKKARLAVITPATEINGKDNRLLEPIFESYQVAFLEGELKSLAEKGHLLKYWDLSIGHQGLMAKGIALRFINGYVPVYGPDDDHDERILSGARRDEKKLEYIAQIKKGEPKTLNHIACKAKNPTEKAGVFCGTEALGVLKADIDQLGLLMACGLKPERFTLSRLATLSRQLDNYFTVYLPHFLMNETTFNDIYTVFAGGDDLFLIGPWNRIIDLAIVLRSSFSDYVCHNKKVHFSAGISLHKSHTPIDSMAETSESALEKSKYESEEKNRLTLFSETVTWLQMEELGSAKQTLGQWLDKGWISKAMLYRLNEFIQMADQETRLIKDLEIHIDDMSCTKWRSMLAYSAERNVAREMKGEERRKVVNEVAGSMARWLTEYGGKLKIPLWYILYNNR